MRVNSFFAQGTDSVSASGIVGFHSFMYTSQTPSKPRLSVVH